MIVTWRGAGTEAEEVDAISFLSSLFFLLSLSSLLFIIFSISLVSVMMLNYNDVYLYAGYIKCEIGV